MATIQRILVPVDFSSDSQNALDYAVGLAKSLGATIDLLHCYRVNLAVISPYGPTLPPNFEADLREAAGERLHEWSQKASASGVQISEHLQLVFPSEGIVDLAEELGSDLIVMGTRGLSGFKHVVLGSVAERVVRTASCPVLTVKEESKS